MAEKIQVLYVDDETALLDIGKVYLERTKEFSVVTAPSAADALIRLKTLEVKAIVADYQMPGMDGIEFLKKIRAKDTQIPFIIFTGKGREEIAVEAFENGADFYVQKGGTPVSQFSDLAQKIRIAVERRTAESQLHETEVRFRALIQNSSDIIRILDRSGTILYDSPSSERILGYSAGSLVGKKAIDFIHPDDWERVGSDMTEVFEKRNLGVPTEFRIRKADGDYILVESVATNHLNTPGIGGIVVTTRPVSKQKQTQKELDESRERFQQVAENTGEWIWEVDAVGLYTYCSPAVQSILGYSPDELVEKKHFYDLFAPDLRDALKEVSLAAFEKKEPFWHFENPNLHKDGRTVILETSGSPVLDKKGILLGFRGVDQDITERKRAEEKLRANERKFRSIFEHSLDAIFLTIPDGRILAANPAACRMLGFTEEEICTGGRNLIIDTSDPHLEGALQERKASGSFHGEIIFVRKDRTKIPCEISSGIFHDTDGSPMTIIVAHDITQRRHVEETLRERGRLYRSLLDKAPELIIIHKNGIILYANPAMAKTLGYQPEEALHRPVSDFIVPEHHERVAAAVSRRMHGETVEPYDLELIGKNGGRRAVIVSGSQVEFEGEPASLIMLTDITERKVLEDTVREREQFTKEIISNAKEGIIVYDRNFNYVIWNSFMETLTGTSAREVQGKNAFDLFPHLKEQNVHILLQRALAGEIVQSPDTPYTVEKTKKSGWVSGIYSPHYNGKGEIIGVIGIVRDITERKQVEEALQQANRKLNLLSSVTRHDIINQLSALDGYLDLSRDLLHDPVKLEEYIAKEQNIARTIKAQILFTKDYQDLGIKAPEWQNVHDSVLRAQESLSLRGIVVETDSPTLEVFADPLITKVFYNLMDNAVRHGGTRMKTIRFYGAECGNDYCIICEDDGIGIPAEQKQKIFERGYGKNTGLGLFLVREILAITGISIIENGVPGKGARFEITVPKGGYRYVKRAGAGIGAGN